MLRVAFVLRSTEVIPVFSDLFTHAPPKLFANNVLKSSSLAFAFCLCPGLCLGLCLGLCVWPFLSAYAFASASADASALVFHSASASALAFDFALPWLRPSHLLWPLPWPRPLPLPCPWPLPLSLAFAMSLAFAYAFAFAFAVALAFVFAIAFAFAFCFCSRLCFITMSLLLDLLWLCIMQIICWRVAKRL